MISLQQQSLDDSCMSASIAMVLGVPEKHIIADFHEGYIAGTLEPRALFEDLGVPFERCYADERILQPNSIYILFIPSLNVVGGSHAIVAHITREKHWILYDPNDGKPNRKYYTHSPERAANEKLAYLAGDWIPGYRFDIDALHAYRQDPSS